VTPEAAQLAETLERLDRGLCLVVTGAGTSHASGIPTFRGTDPDAVWSHTDIEMATFEFFRRNPVGQWSWYLQRFRHIDGAEPNPAHRALTDLESWHTARGGEFLLVTQNIDCLHEAAGTKNLVKVHGSSDRLRCASWSCEMAAPRGSLPRDEVDLDAFRERPDRDTLPRCPTCGEFLRAHVLFFDEYYTEHVDYRFADVEAAASRCHLALFVGTSFAVGVTELVLRAAIARGATVASIDPAGQPTGPGLDGVLRLREAAEDALPAICHYLGA
jgi:NAD-dependent deacetylase